MIGGGVGASEGVVDLVRRQLAAVEQLPGRVVRRDRRAAVRLGFGVGGGVRRNGGVIWRLRRRSASASPVSSNDFIDCSTQIQPSATPADVSGLALRSRWMVVTLVTPSEPSASSHSSRLGGSRAAVGVVQRSPRHHQPPRRLDLLDRADDGILTIGEDHAIAATGLQRRLEGGAVEVATGELGVGDRRPHLLGAGADERLIDVDRGGRGHDRSFMRSFGGVFSSWCRRPTMAATVGSAYLEIHRSWISRIGTGLR